MSIVKTLYYEDGMEKCRIWNDGLTIWYDHEKGVHREDGPAVIKSDGSEHYYLYGKHLKDIHSVEELIIKMIIE